MDQPMQASGVGYDEVAVMDLEEPGLEAPMTRGRLIERTPLGKTTRSLSDGGGTPHKHSPSPHILDAARRASKDDSSIRDSPSMTGAPPVTPHRTEFPMRSLSLQMPARAATPPTQQPTSKPVPLSPKLENSQIYASPTNILPRRSRGLDFSRAATSLHHSILAEQSSPDSSPTIGGRAMNIPGRSGGFGAPEQTSNSLWSMMGNQERMHISSSLGSAANLVSDSSSGEDEDMMDEDMTDEPYILTPQVSRTHNVLETPGRGGSGWGHGGSPAVNSLLSFQQRQRPRRPSRKARGLLGLGFASTSSTQNLSKSPPNNAATYGTMTKDMPAPHSRRESISWAANQLNISGSESEDSPQPGVNVDGVLGPGTDGQNRVVRRTVTRRGNLLPKTKNFARIRAALAEEGQPVESEFRREAEVVRQVRESDMDLEPSRQGPPPLSVTTTTQSSPSMPMQELMDEMTDVDAMVMDPNPLGLSSSFQKQAQLNSKGKAFWDTFSEAGSVNGASVTTTPPQQALLRGSSSGMSLEDMNMDSPLTNSAPTGINGFMFPMTGTSSSGNDTPQNSGTSSIPQSGQLPPSAADITRRINSKRRRDDDFDPVSFKRRAVSPGMSVHNSPIMQSPMQHAPWGSRPGSNGGDKAGSGSENGDKGRTNGHKARIGFQGMVDTNDGITRLSIE